MDSAMQWLVPQSVELELDVRNRWEVLRAISAIIERRQRLDAPTVFRALWRREAAASTGMGGGFAIPHARIAGIDEPVTIYARTTAPVRFAAPDGHPVTEVFAILVPADGAQEEHLELLARVAEAFSDRVFRERLAATSDPDAIRCAFAEWIGERRSAAPAGPAALRRDVHAPLRC